MILWNKVCVDEVDLMNWVDGVMSPIFTRSEHERRWLVTLLLTSILPVADLYAVPVRGPILRFGLFFGQAAIAKCFFRYFVTGICSCLYRSQASAKSSRQ